MMSEKESVANCTHTRQYGVGVKDGSSKLTKVLRSHADQDPDMCIVSLDIQSAFQTVSRASIAHCLQDHPIVALAFRAWYPENTTVAHRLQLADHTFAVVTANQGVDQGCPLASYAYTKGGEAHQDDLEADLKQLHSHNQIHAYLDDTYIICRRRDVQEAIRLATHHFRRSNQHIQPTKTKIWTPRPHPTHPGNPPLASSSTTQPAAHSHNPGPSAAHPPPAAPPQPFTVSS